MFLIKFNTSNTFKTNSPAGEYNILYATGTSTILPFHGEKAIGLLYYQAGIAVLTSSLFKVAASGGIVNNTVVNNETGGKIIMVTASSGPAGLGVEELLVSSSISGSALTHSVIDCKTFTLLTRQSLTQQYTSAVLMQMSSTTAVPQLICRKVK